MRLNLSRSRVLSALLLLLVFSSCTNRKNMVYFGKTNGSADVKSAELVYNPGDVLSITVMGRDLEAARPFNIPLQNYNANQGSYTSGTPAPPGYLVDADGMIDFPVLGKLRISGLSHLQTVELLREKMAPYLREPTILVRLINFRITVLGEVRNPGTFTLPDEKVSLPEAIGIAGDLNITGRRQDVLVIRTIDGKKTETRLDLSSQELFSSPVYYLRQNDIVYVEPNKAKINSARVNPANVGLVISVLSLLVTMTVLLTK